MTIAPELSTPGDPPCSRCGHLFSAHEHGDAFACLAADPLVGECLCPGYARVFNGQLRRPGDYRPDPEQHTQANLEMIAAIEAAVSGDWLKMTEVFAGSDNPPQLHAIAGAVQAAWILQRLADDPLAVLDRLRQQIIESGGAL